MGQVGQKSEVARLRAFPRDTGTLCNLPFGSMPDLRCRKAAVDAVKKLSQDVGIPTDLKDIVKVEDLDFLSESALADACCPGNPRDTSVEEIKELYKSLLSLKNG